MINNEFSDEYKRSSKYIICLNYIYLGWARISKITFVHMTFGSDSISSFYNSFYTGKSIASYNTLVNNNFPDITLGLGFTSAFRFSLFDNNNNNAIWYCRIRTYEDEGCFLQCSQQTLQRIPNLHGFGIIL